MAHFQKVKKYRIGVCQNLKIILTNNFPFLSVERQNWTFETRGEFLSFLQSIIMYTKGGTENDKINSHLIVTGFDPD